jgi:hypothetical protein
MNASGVQGGLVVRRFRLAMMGTSSGVCMASVTQVINDDEGDDKFEAVEALSIALLAGRFLEGSRRDVS